jgi:hypothetical protein
LSRLGDAGDSVLSPSPVKCRFIVGPDDSHSLTESSHYLGQEKDASGAVIDDKIPTMEVIVEEKGQQRDLSASEKQKCGLSPGLGNSLRTACRDSETDKLCRYVDQDKENVEINIDDSVGSVEKRDKSDRGRKGKDGMGDVADRAITEIEKLVKNSGGSVITETSKSEKQELERESDKENIESLADMGRQVGKEGKRNSLDSAAERNQVKGKKPQQQQQRSGNKDGTGNSNRSSTSGYHSYEESRNQRNATESKNALNLAEEEISHKSKDTGLGDMRDENRKGHGNSSARSGSIRTDRGSCDTGNSSARSGSIRTDRGSCDTGNSSARSGSIRTDRGSCDTGNSSARSGSIRTDLGSCDTGFNSDDLRDENESAEHNGERLHRNALTPQGETLHRNSLSPVKPVRRTSAPLLKDGGEGDNKCDAGNGSFAAADASDELIAQMAACNVHDLETSEDEGQGDSSGLGAVGDVSGNADESPVGVKVSLRQSLSKARKQGMDSVYIQGTFVYSCFCTSCTLCPSYTFSTILNTYIAFIDC